MVTDPTMHHKKSPLSVDDMSFRCTLKWSPSLTDERVMGYHVFFLCTNIITRSDVMIQIVPIAPSWKSAFHMDTDGNINILKKI